MTTTDTQNNNEAADDNQTNQKEKSYYQLGGLGPNLGTDSHIEKTELWNKKWEYDKNIQETNRSKYKPSGTTPRDRSPGQKPWISPLLSPPRKKGVRIYFDEILNESDKNKNDDSKSLDPLTKRQRMIEYGKQLYRPKPKKTEIVQEEIEEDETEENEEVIENGEELVESSEQGKS